MGVTSEASLLLSSPPLKQTRRVKIKPGGKYHHGHSSKAVELLRVHLLEDQHPGHWFPGHRHPGHRLPQPGRLCHWHRRLNWVHGGTNGGQRNHSTQTDVISRKCSKTKVGGWVCRGDPQFPFSFWGQFVL